MAFVPNIYVMIFHYITISKAALTLSRCWLPKDTRCVNFQFRPNVSPNLKVHTMHTRCHPEPYTKETVKNSNLAPKDTRMTHEHPEGLTNDTRMTHEWPEVHTMETRWAHDGHTKATLWILIRSVSYLMMLWRQYNALLMTWEWYRPHSYGIAARTSACTVLT